MPLQSVTEIDWQSLKNGRNFYPSPSHWEDEVIYFLLVDRFSDAKEKDYRDNSGHLVTSGTTPLYTAADNGNAIQTVEDAERWRNAGRTWVGGTLEGLRSKLGYLRRLGVSTLWISPILKQVASDEGSYHGYGVQDFLDIDPHFGTREQLRDLVEAAHALDIRVILDVILNHSGDVFAYEMGEPLWNGETFPVEGFKDAAGNPTLPFAPVNLGQRPDAFSDAAIWPLEFQTPETFTRKGRIRNFDYYPEYVDGDFFSLRDIHHGERRVQNGVDQIDQYQVSPALQRLCDVHKYWIAYADLDGYRLDTVKHMDGGATRYFVSVMHEFAETLGKDHFLVIGEITGGRQFAFDQLETTGLDAALGIDDERAKMVAFVQGQGQPSAYFDLFRNSLLVGKESHTWFRDKVVTSVDDHDHVDEGNHKHRFAAYGFARLSLAVMAVNATTLGIPCIYYGTEQLFDGEGDGEGSDQYIREAMFGGAYGPFRSKDAHCFDEGGFVYRELGKIHALRRSQLALRRGRQYLREISGDGVHFGVPRKPDDGFMRSIVAWSRILDTVELLCAVNTDPDFATEAFVTVDNDLHVAGNTLVCLYSTESAQIGTTLTIESRNGKAVHLRMPAAGFAVYG